VTDQGSLSIASPAPSGYEIAGNRNTAIPNPATTETQRWFGLRRSRFPHCIICGRSSRWVDPFPRLPRRFG
jgi:hypothetical protein